MTNLKIKANRDFTAHNGEVFLKGKEYDVTSERYAVVYARGEKCIVTGLFIPKYNIRPPYGFGCYEVVGELQYN